MIKSNGRKRLFNILNILCIALFFLFCFVQAALARAGGGGGGGGGGIVSGILTVILLPVFFIYSAIITFIAYKKSSEAKKLLLQISKSDASWNLKKIKTDIEIAFFTIQKAWMERDQMMAKDYMSERLFQKHKLQTDMMIEQHQKNILLYVNLTGSSIVQAVDFKDDSKDAMWILIKGSMIDYMVNDQTYDVISGDPNNKEEFKELWKFIRGPLGWVVDEIDQKVSIHHLLQMHCFKEE